MNKISKVDAFQGMDETDFKVMDQELESIWNTKGDKEMTQQFFLDEKGDIFLKVYYDGEEVQSICFKNKSGLTEVGKKAVGRPSLGTTKKVSLTLPDEIWEMIETRKKTWGVSQSQTLRMMIEGYWNSEDAVVITSNDAAEKYDELENYFHEKYGEETENQIFTMGVRALHSLIFGEPMKD
ncbi:CopG family transcriptional regulator [Niallia sp. Krafla_26]|uniref:ribbon-helix-helix domain-containing protein n=1 Tax=Niallia sp. Krafla_26 TaxID=3064703 RepID=UPI003D169470